MSNSRHNLILPAVVGLLVAALWAPAAAAQGVVAGTVVRTGTLTPVEGAQIAVEGTRLGTTTDASGRFRIVNVPGERARLQVRRISFTPTTIDARVGDTEIRVVLGESTVRLDEVVITGTAVGQQVRQLGNSISKISAVEEVERSGVSDLGSLVNARAAGVIVTSGSGRIGSGPSINVRGRSTISLSQQPLLYIDGVRVTNDIGTGQTRIQGASGASRLNDISPEDIESIEILKGPAAATIYGTEAANGVIQIITKKGRLGGSPQWTALLRQGTQWFMDAEGRMPTNYGVCSSAALVGPASPAMACRGQPIGTIVSWNAVQQEDSLNNRFWKNGHLQTYSASLSGGQQLVRYHVSGTYDDNKGIEPHNFAKQFTGHANLTVAPSEKIDVTSSLNMVRGRAHLGTDYGASTLFGAEYGSPMSTGTPFRGFFLFTPDMVYALFDNTQDISRFTGSLQLNHRPASWFSHRLTVGLDQTTEDNQSLQRFAPEQYRPLLTPVNALGQIFQDIRNISYYTADYGGSANFSLTPRLASTTSIGGQFYQKRFATSQATGRQFPAPGVTTVNAAAVREGGQDLIENTTIGVYAQQQFGWQDRLFLTGAVRIDNNSAFGDDFSLVTYPKVSASWVISEEPFWGPAQRWVNTLKLRSAFGQSGQQPDAFTALQTYQPITGTLDRPAVSPQEIGNPNLKPERGTELEVGFEAGLLDRVSMDFTYFSRRTKDAILLQPIPPSMGFPGNQFVNIGEVRNHGFELQTHVQAIARENLGWDLGLNFGTTKDKIQDLGGIPFIGTLLPTQRHVQGYPIGGFWTKRVTSATLTGTGPGAVLSNVLCDNGAGGEVACATAPVVFLGTPTPKLSGAVTSSLTFRKNLRLYAMVDFKRGHKLLAAQPYTRCAALGVCEAVVRPENYSPEYIANVRNGASLVIADQFVQDASFTKLREVSLSYEVPERFARMGRVQRALITLAGRNLHTWTDFEGLDPESRSAIANISQFDQAVTPSLAQFVATFNFTF